MISELIVVPGVEIAGPLPPEVQSFTVLSAEVSKKAADVVAARRLLLFLFSSSGSGIKGSGVGTTEMSTRRPPGEIPVARENRHHCSDCIGRKL